MAINIPIVTDFNSKGLQDASNAFQNFKSKIGEAEGAMGKMKAGFSAAGDFIKANAAQFTAVAGAAIAGFVVKAIGEFQDLALAVDKFRDATGVTLDEASRWTEVAGDIGVDAGTIETALNRMNKQASDGSGLFKELGVQLKRHKDGEFDPHATFLDVIDALKNIKDPADKARIASGLLGKGWQEMANLIEEGSGPLLARMREVSEAKLINEDEVKKAEAFRDTMDTLNDTFRDVVLKLAEDFIPLLTTIVQKMMPIVGLAGDVATAIAGPSSTTQAFLDMGAALDEVVAKLGFEQVMKDLNLSADELAVMIDKNLVPSTYRMRDAWIEGYRAMIDAKGVADDTTDSIGDLEQAIAELKGEIDERQAWRNLQDDIQQAGEAAIRAFKEQTPEALRASEGALDEARLAAAEYIAELDGIPDDIKTDIIAGLDTANITEIERTLAYLARPRVAGIIVGVGETPSEVTGRGSRSAMSLTTPGAVNIMPTSTTGTGNVIVNVGGSVTTENDLIESVRKGLVNAQRNGSGLVYNNF